MGIIHDLGVGPVFLDTSIFIYFIEEDEKYIQLVSPIFEAIAGSRLFAVTSGITLLETLVVPLKERDLELSDQYEKILTDSKGLTLLSLDRDLLREAAVLRATYNIKTPDALQIAGAKVYGCKIFVTNDRRLPTIPNLTILQLSDYL